MSFSYYLTLMVLFFFIYFGIFPLDYRLTGVKLALTVFYKICIELNVIHGLRIVQRKVQIKLWSTLASLWNSNLKISIPGSKSFSSFWKWKLGSTSVSWWFSPAASLLPIRLQSEEWRVIHQVWQTFDDIVVAVRYERTFSIIPAWKFSELCWVLIDFLNFVLVQKGRRDM